MTFKEEDCIWIGKKPFRGKKKKRYHEQKEKDVAWMDSQGSDEIEEPENNDILFGNIIERPVQKPQSNVMGGKKFEQYEMSKSESEDEGEMDHLDIFF